MPVWIEKAAPIFMLLVVVGVVLWRLPKVDIGHSAAFKQRRFLNWFPLGLMYAFLYFGRYNIIEATSALGKLVDNAAFGTIFAVGAWSYGLSFLINGPLTDKLGGRFTILLATAGSAIANILLGLLAWSVVGGHFDPPGGLVLWMAVLYGVNMYFQSFGAVSIVKVNAAWFHVRERGVQGGIFGILISLGIYFGYDWSKMIVTAAPTSPWLAFFVPAAVLLVICAVGFFAVRDAPKDAGHTDFDVGDAFSHEAADAKPPSAADVFLKMARNPVIITIVAIEFCTGFLRNGVMSWYPKFAKATGLDVKPVPGQVAEFAIGDFISDNWGMLLCVFGIVGGMFAGIISDKVFQSRRGPVATVLYAGISIGAVGMFFCLEQPWIGLILVFMALNYVGVHGMLSGTASADFGGRKNAGVAVGVIDGFVYLGTGLQSLIVGQVLPTGDDAKNPANWIYWPIAMVPIALVGLALCLRVWNARAKPGSGH
ncbi:MAG: MFS transporter [Deltaproteobacteria bacterium]|nr:MFS transporter [Deltaproteobacteria bacterium]